MAPLATTRARRNNASTTTKSEPRSPISVPTTVESGTRSRLLTYTHRQASPKRGNTRFKAYAPKMDTDSLTTGIRGTPAPRSWMPQRMPRIICDNVVMAIISTRYQTLHSVRTTCITSRKFTLWNSHTTSTTEMATGNRYSIPLTAYFLTLAHLDVDFIPDAVVLPITLTLPLKTSVP